MNILKTIGATILGGVMAVVGWANSPSGKSVPVDTPLGAALTYVQYGGTSSTTLTGILKGNGTSAVGTAKDTDVISALGYTPATSTATFPQYELKTDFASDWTTNGNASSTIAKPACAINQSPKWDGSKWGCGDGGAGNFSGTSSITGELAYFDGTHSVTGSTLLEPMVQVFLLQE
jgi:hypothetical protein